MPFWEVIPQYIIAGLALWGAIQAFRNRKTLTATRADVVATKAVVAEVQEQTNGMSKRLEALAHKEGKAEGVAETKAKAKTKRQT